MLNDAENVVADAFEELVATEQAATDELCEKIASLVEEHPIETRLILPHLDRLSFDDLQYVVDKLDSYRVEVQATLERKREERLTDLQERIRMHEESARRSKEELAKLVPTPTKAKMENPSTPKYRDPTKPENTWAGRGKKPTWLNEKLEAGAKLEDFLIDKPGPVPDDTGF